MNATLAATPSTISRHLSGPLLGITRSSRLKTRGLTMFPYSMHALPTYSDFHNTSVLAVLLLHVVWREATDVVKILLDQKIHR